MLESKVEKRFKTRLESYGFKVIKFTSPGTAGVPDRLIMRPTWSPGPPMFCELKRPDEEPTRAQVLTMQDMVNRGCIVLDFCNSYERVDEITTALVKLCEAVRIDELGEMVADANKLKLDTVT